MLSLLDHGYKVTIIDNLDNSFQEAFNRMKVLAGYMAGNMKFIQVRMMLFEQLSNSLRW